MRHDHTEDKLRKAKRWTNESWGNYLTSCGILHREREKLSKFQKMFNVKPIPPHIAMKNRDEFVAFKKTSQYKDLVSAAWGLGRFYKHNATCRDNQKLPWEEGYKVGNTRIKGLTE